MAKLKIPYLVTKPGRDGARHYWQPSAELRRKGWRPRRLDDDEARAIVQAREINAELEDWRAGVAAPAAGGAGARTLGGAIDRFERSPEFARLADKTRYEYRRCLAIARRWAQEGATPLAAIAAPDVKRFYWALAEHAPAQANAVMRTLKLLFNWARSEGLCGHNPVSEIRLTGTKPRVAVWLPHQVALVVAAADAMARPSLGDAVLMGKYLGQRQGDLLRATWLQRQGGVHHIRQSKRGARVEVPEAPALAARLEAARARLDAAGNRAPQILVNETTGRGYVADTFRHDFVEARRAAAAQEAGDPEARAVLERAAGRARPLAELQFLDLRDTAVTGLAEAGCSLPEICAITGHGERSAHGIMRHYLALTGEMAEAAIAKWVAHEERRERG